MLQIIKIDNLKMDQAYLGKNLLVYVVIYNLKKQKKN